MTARARTENVRPRGMSQTNAADPVGEIDYGPLRQRLGYVMRRAQLAIFEDFIETCALEDIRPGQYSALTIIDCNPGLSQAQVASALGIKTPNFVSMVDEMQARGLLRRAALPGDRRRHALVLTAEGRRLTAALHSRADIHEQRLMACVGEQVHRRMFGWLAAIAGLGEDASTKGAVRVARDVTRRKAR